MTRVQVTNQTRGSVLGRAVLLADSWLLRMRGYLGRPAPAKGEGLLLSPCQGVHMYGLGYSLDVVFISRAGQVMALYPELAPRKRTAFHSGAAYALELPPGTIAASDTRVDDYVAWKPRREPTRRLGRRFLRDLRLTRTRKVPEGQAGR